MLFQRRLATNSFLKKIGIKGPELCTFCNSEEETLIRPFWFCKVTSQFWQEFSQWMITSNEFKENNLKPETVLGHT